MRARRVIVRLLWVIGAIVLVVAGLLWIALSSEFAARKLIALGLARAGPGVTIGQVSGRLRGPLVLRRIGVRTPAASTTVDSVLLEWSPSGLLRRQLRIDRLQVVGVHVVLPDSAPSAPDTTKPERPRVPMDVVFGDVALRGLSVDAPAGARLRAGEIRVAGRADDYRLSARADASLPKLEQVHLELAAGGNLERLTHARADADLLDGRITVTGPVRWWPKIGWDLSVNAQGLRPATLLERPAEWPGTLMFRATTAGVLDSTGPAGRLVLDILGGSLRRQPLRGHAELGVADSVYRIETLALGWGSAQVTASGTIADSLSLRYRLAIAALGTALPGGSGSLMAQGTARGLRTAPRVRLELDGRRLSYGTNRLARLAGRADVDLAPDGRNTAYLRADRVRVGEQAIDSVSMALQGTRADHQASASVGAPSLRASLGLSGGLHRKEWKGRVTGADLQGSAVGGDWRLEHVARLDASAAAGSLEQLCLRLQDQRASRVCAGGLWRGAAGWRASATLERLPLALADSLLPKGRSLTGTLDGRLDASTIGRRLDGQLRLAASRAVVTFPEASGARLRRVAFDTAGIEVSAGRDGVRGALTIHASGGDRAGIGHLAARFALPRYRRLGARLQTQPVEARLDGRIDDLGIARTFTRQVDSIRGNLALKLEASGTVGAPHVDGSLGLRKLLAWFPENRSVSGGLDARLGATVSKDRRLAAELRMLPRELRLAFVRDSATQRLAVDGGGLEVRADSGGIRGKLDLGLRDTTGAQMASLSGGLELPGYAKLAPPVRTQPVTLRLGAKVPDLGFARGLATGVDTLAGRATLELAVAGSVGAPRLDGRLRLDRLVARLSQGARVSGALDGDVRAAVAADSALTADLRLIPRGVGVEYGAADSARRMTVDSTGLRVRAGRDGVNASFDLRLLDSARTGLATMTGRLGLPRYRKVGLPLAPQPLSAKLEGRVDDLSIARGFSAELDSVAGRVTLDVDVRGTAGRPQLVGGLRVQNAEANLPRLGLRLRQLQLAAEGDQAGAVTVDGRVRSGAGLLTLKGRSPVRPTVREPGRLRLEGDSVEAMNTAEVRLLASPRLDVAVAGDSVDVQGELRIPYARVELSDIPQTAVPPSDDVVFTDTAGTRAKRQRVTARVRVVLGDSISFKGFNFTANLGGDLLAVAVPERPATGSGAIIIREGHYKAYGQDLTISDGRLRFAGGPVDNPGLDIRATRTAEDSVVAGVKIAGTLKSPQVTIFSNPPMSQGRALQYLVLGHPLGQSGGTQGSLASQAASSLGLRGGNLLAKSLGKGVGLDQARIETKGDLQQASFVAGKYLSPNLYVSYGIGLFDPVSTLRLRYALSSKWTLQAEKGEGSGADILYRVEAGGEPPRPQ